MHRLFRKELDTATGVSEFVVAQNLDIRGFSDWSLEVDSAQTALFLTKLYAKLIDTYFSSASYIKPTGDGLLVVEAFEEPELMEVLSRTVASARQIVDDFGSLCDGDRMINFSVPTNVGIGIARGTAARLASKKTLDYSGRVLNLASRLMDLARPKGIVVDEGFGLDFLPSELKGDFAKHDVYLKGVSPNVALGVRCWPPDIEIPEIYLHPLNEKRWEHEILETTRRQLEQADGQNYRFNLDPVPLPNSEIVCQINHPAVTPGKRKARGRRTNFPFDVEQDEVAGVAVARIDQKALAKALEGAGVGPSWGVRVKVSYRIP